jgi:hypothetical protein
VVGCARHDLETRRSISEEIAETRSYAVRRVLPCCLVSLTASSHAVDLALEELSLPQAQPKLHLVANPAQSLAYPAAPVTGDTRT